MADRYTDTNKWNDDWFLDLEPRFKCAWQWLTDNCNGGGILKISFRKMSSEIRGDVSREEFDAVFAGRVFWISEDTVWVPGVLKRFYKKLSYKNRAHVNIANMVLRETAGKEFSGRAADALRMLREIVFLSENPPHDESNPEPRADLDPDSARGSDEVQLKYIIKNKNTDLREGGVGEETKADSEAALHALIKLYPLQEAFEESLGLLRGIVRTPADYDLMATAIQRYKAKLVRQNTAPEFVKRFPKFLKEWRDWTREDAGSCDIVPVDWIAEADYCCQAVVLFSPDQSAQAREWLSESRWELLQKIGGLNFVRTLKRNPKDLKLLADRLKATFSPAPANSKSGVA